MENYITASQFCLHHQIAYSFLQQLNEHGLVEIITVEEKPCLKEEYLPQIEKMIRLYYELDINMEGLETITHLLGRIELMQQQLQRLENRLSLYEPH